MKRYLIILLLFSSCLYEKENKEHKHVLTLKPTDIKSIEIFENDHYETTKITIYNRDTIEIVLKNIQSYTKERPHTRARKLYYNVKLNVGKKVFRYQFWVCHTDAVFYIYS
jgi:hypothetical protein